MLTDLSIKNALTKAAIKLCQLIKDQMIPKTIYAAWYGGEIPSKFKAYIETWKAVMPDYKVVILNEKNTPIDKVVEESLHRKKYCVTSNYIRIKHLYENGGIYLDTDIETLGRFDKYLNEKLVFGIEDEYVCNGAVLIAEKGHPFLKRCLELLEQIDYSDVDVDLTTGPRLMTKVAKEFGWQPKTFGRHKDFLITHPSVFYPYHYTENLNRDKHIKENTLTIHHWSISWGDLVSIVIPCYNQGHFLNDAINSALTQTYGNCEVIVVNDGSTDNTEEVCKEYRNKINYIKQANKGLSAARNTGIKASKGKWIVPLDSDDKLAPNFVMFTKGQSDIVTTYLQTFGKRVDIWKPPIITPKYTDFLTGNKIHYCSIFKREIFDLVQYNEEMFIRGKVGANGYEDWMFWLDATRLGYKVKVIQQVLMYYRKHGKSMIDEATSAHTKITNFIKQYHHLK